MCRVHKWDFAGQMFFAGINGQEGINMNLKELSSDGKVAYLIKPILKVLQEAGGQLERSKIKERIADLDDQIAEFAETVKKSQKTGNQYKEFDFKFNFAIKDLLFNDLFHRTRSWIVRLLSPKHHVILVLFSGQLRPLVTDFSFLFGLIII